jgi:AraC-like DNA-binding protein
MRQIQSFAAPAKLSHWIDGAVIVHLGSEPGVSRFPATPHAMLTLRLALSTGHADAARVLCPPVTFHTLSTEPVSHAHGGGLIAMGLLVRPEAAACLLGAACGAVVDAVLTWDALAGPCEAARLEATVQHAVSDWARLRALMESFDRVMQAVSKGRDQVFSTLCAAVGLHGAQAADTLGLGRRQLERRCLAVLGLSPKQFQRIVRFHHALSMAVAGDAARLATVAVETGFFDQSHLARDARSLAGVPIGSLIAQAQPDTPWWPLAAGVRAPPFSHGA